MPALFIGIFLGLALGLFILVSLGFFKFQKLIVQKRTRELSELREYHQRLQIVVSNLLSKANEIDQESKYLIESPDARWSNHLAETCSELVQLGNTLLKIDILLSTKDVKATRSCIMTCLNTSWRLRKQLSDSKKYIIKSKKITN